MPRRLRNAASQPIVTALEEVAGTRLPLRRVWPSIGNQLPGLISVSIPRSIVSATMDASRTSPAARPSQSSASRRAAWLSRPTRVPGRLFLPAARQPRAG